MNPVLAANWLDPTTDPEVRAHEDALVAFMNTLPGVTDCEQGFLGYKTSLGTVYILMGVEGVYDEAKVPAVRATLDQAVVEFRKQVAAYVQTQVAAGKTILVWRRKIKIGKLSNLETGSESEGYYISARFCLEKPEKVLAA